MNVIDIVGGLTDGTFEGVVLATFGETKFPLQTRFAQCGAAGADGMVIVNDGETVSAHSAVADLTGCVRVLVGRGGVGGGTLGVCRHIFHLDVQRFVETIQH